MYSIFLTWCIFLNLLLFPLPSEECAISSTNTFKIYLKSARYLETKALEVAKSMPRNMTIEEKIKNNLWAVE